MFFTFPLPSSPLLVTAPSINPGSYLSCSLGPGSSGVVPFTCYHRGARDHCLSPSAYPVSLAIELGCIASWKGLWEAWTPLSVSFPSPVHRVVYSRLSARHVGSALHLQFHLVFTTALGAEGTISISIYI